MFSFNSTLLLLIFVSVFADIPVDGRPSVRSKRRHKRCGDCGGGCGGGGCGCGGGFGGGFGGFGGFGPFGPFGGLGGLGGIPVVPVAGTGLVGASALGTGLVGASALHPHAAPLILPAHSNQDGKPTSKSMDEKIEGKADAWSPSSRGAAPGNACSKDADCVEGAKCEISIGLRYCVCGSGKRPQGTKCV